MRTDLFDFELPEDLIALHPANERDASRLLHVRQAATGAAFEDLKFPDLVALLKPGDALVFNDTRVIPAFLSGERLRGESRVAISVNLLSQTGPASWQALARPARRMQVGDRLVFSNAEGATLSAEVQARGEAGEVSLTFASEGDALAAALDRVGQMPLPHYIAARRRAGEEDRESYQTIYAKTPGAVAAPTAGLHFTDRILYALKTKGVALHHLTLHVGGGTFLPVKADDTRDHKMHAEWGTISEETAEALNKARRSGGRIVAVGTTSLRLLETAADTGTGVQPFSGSTDIFITPGYTFEAVDALITNFHLPCSTLFMLVSAFSGLDTMKQAYRHAIEQRYRFYSYGDACFLEPGAS